MNRLRRWSVLVGIAVLGGLLPGLRGQDAPPPAEKKEPAQSADKWLVDRALVVSPAAAPVPNLKYRFYPMDPERKDGNAVPMYLRFAHERIDARKKMLIDKPAEWNKLPLEKLLLAEVKDFVGGYKYNLHQLELGARRKTADWNYSLDAGDPIGMLVPDAQEMRMHAPILVLKARLEIAEGHYAEAIRTLETGFSFSQQVGQGPFLISSLVGIACASQFADEVLELAERPGSPNLYWALTTLPRPLIELRHAYELEQKMLEMQFPEMADLARPRTAEEWDATLLRVRQELDRISKFEKPQHIVPVNEPAAKSPDLPAARKYLTEVVGLTAANVESMPPAQILLLYLSNFYHEMRDDVFKGSYLPYVEARSLNLAARERLNACPDTEAGWVVRMFLPAVMKVQLSDVRLARKIAALRTIEALRMHAAAHGGQLPDKLDEVTIVPVPNDPGTGKSFEYQRDGATATLISRLLGEPLEQTGLRYRITVRK